MDTKEWRTVDKSNWERGEWDAEPDKMQFPDAATGLPCLIVRNDGGSLCGYVGVSEGHWAFGRDYGDVDADVHGGLTFADRCHPNPEGEHKGICHIPGEGEPDHVWWLGFDCAHGGDYMPAYEARNRRFYSGSLETYRDLNYVKAQIRGLARQLAHDPNDDPIDLCDLCSEMKEDCVCLPEYRREHDHGAER